MKKITLLSIALLISYIGQSQDTRLADLISEYQNLHSTPDPISHFFNEEEITILRDHFSQQNENETEESRAGVVNDVTLFGVNFRDGDDPTFLSFNTSTPGTLTDINLAAPINNGDFETAGDIDPRNPNLAYSLAQNGTFFSLDITTGIYTSLGIISPPQGHRWSGIEFDPSTNILYGVAGDFLLEPTSSLSIIDIDELSSTLIGEISDSGIISIATDGEGNFYSHDVIQDVLYSIDPETAEATVIGGLGFDASGAQDMEWDSATGTLWMTAFNFDNVFIPELRTVNTSTGETTLVGRIGEDPNDQIVWCSIPNPSLSVNDNSISQVSISPNPTQGVLNINAQIPMGQITIYNSLGQNVATYTANNLQTYSVDTAGMANGLYVIELTTALGTVTEKFVKQ